MGPLTPVLVQLIKNGELKYSREFYRFVFETIVQSAKMERFGKAPEGGAPKHLSPEKICALVGNRLAADFGPLKKTVLDDWGVKSARDIGIAVFQMASGGLLILSGGETEDDFARGGLDND